jgi:hypothetical protein
MMTTNSDRIEKQISAEKKFEAYCVGIANANKAKEQKSNRSLGSNDIGIERERTN